jgi:CTP:molybdopterin cytidylyltransferase MocA
MTVTAAPWAIVLAAGPGTRFGGGKLLARLNGRPLVAQVASILGESIATGLLAGGVAVLPPGDTRLAWYFDIAGLDLADNPDAASGLASSLQRGVAALEAIQTSSPPGGALIVLADQPLLRREVIERLVAEWRTSGRSVRPRYAAAPEVPGHPVLLDRKHWPYVHELTGDQGLGSVLRARSDAVTVVDVPGANPDVDTPADLEQVESDR